MSASVLAGVRVLILEDEFLIAMDVEQLCRDHGASDVTIAGSLADAEAQAPNGSFDVAIIDLMLGGVSTLGFARQLAEKGVPFVFASGYGEADDLAEAFPGVALVGKPYSGTDIINAVAAACGRPNVLSVSGGV